MDTTTVLGPNFAGLDLRTEPGATPGATEATNTRRDNGRMRGMPGPAGHADYGGDDPVRGLSVHTRASGRPVTLSAVGAALYSDDRLDAAARTGHGDRRRVLFWDGTEFLLDDPGAVVFAQGGPRSYFTAASAGTGADETPEAVFVYGQPDFESDVYYPPDGEASAANFSGVYGLACDRTGVWVSDDNTGRALHFRWGSRVADRVLGKPGFGWDDYPEDGPSARVFSSPRGLACDAAGGLYLVDSMHDRVLYFAPGASEATRVWGRAGLASTVTVPPSSGGLVVPYGVAVGPTGMFVSDTYTHRVLFFPLGPDGFPEPEPSAVIGQADMDGPYGNRGGSAGADTLKTPCGLSCDDRGGLYVADASNNRVLYFAPGETTASRVYGQEGSYTSAAWHEPDDPNIGGGRALSWPVDVAWSADGLYVADRDNARVVFYPGEATVATVAYGQMSLVAYEYGLPNSAMSLDYPLSVAHGARGVCIADSPERVLRYE